MKRKFEPIVSIGFFKVSHVHSTGYTATHEIPKHEILEVQLTQLCMGPPLWAYNQGYVTAPNGRHTPLEQLLLYTTIRQIEARIVSQITFTYQGYCSIRSDKLNAT